MTWKVPDRNTCLNLISVAVLLVGLSSAILVYLKAENNLSGVLAYEEEGGSVYPVMPEDSKRYLRGLELYGGEANVLVDKLGRWFVGLWHGKSLATSVAFITIFISFVVFFTANYSPLSLKSDVSIPSDNKLNKTPKKHVE